SDREVQDRTDVARRPGGGGIALHAETGAGIADPYPGVRPRSGRPAGYASRTTRQAVMIAVEQFPYRDRNTSAAPPQYNSETAPGVVQAICPNGSRPLSSLRGQRVT